MVIALHILANAQQPFANLKKRMGPSSPKHREQQDANAAPDKWTRFTHFGQTLLQNAREPMTEV